MNNPVQYADIHNRIIHVLTLYPKLSPTMLQMGLGPQTETKIWKPILEEMILKDEVVREFVTLLSPGGRWKSYTFLSLRVPGELKTFSLEGYHEMAQQAVDASNASRAEAAEATKAEGTQNT